MPRSEYAKSTYYEEEADASYDDSGEEDNYSRANSSAPNDDNGYFITQSERIMNRLHELHASTEWKKVLKHKKGVVVHVQKGQGTVYRGQHVIKGYSPAAVFAVVGTRKLWDEWYQSGSLVDNLNDTTSLTYMVMKGIAGSSTRDLSLVEKVEGSANGTIFFVSSSVDSAKVPRVSGRVRAHIALNGWVLEPVKSGSSVSTNVSYFLQVNVKTFVPKVLTGKYLARRPVCISRIDDYLQKNGAPPLAGVDAEEQQPARSDAGSMRSSKRDMAMAGGAAAGGAAGYAGARKRRSSTGSVRSGKSTGAASSFISAPSIQTEHKSSKDLDAGRELFEDLQGQNGWDLAVDHKGARFHMKDTKGGFPTVKASARIENVTTEQVLGTIISQSARRLWDDRWLSNDLIEPVNGHEHGIYVEVIKGVFPHVSNRHFVLAKGVEREDPTSPNGGITYIARSTKSASPNSKLSSTEGQLDVSGWRIEDDGGSVTVEHILQTDLKTDKVKSPALRKTMVVAVAKAPRNLQEFIDERGYAPYFVRWEEGDAHIERDDGDLENGEATFYISSNKSKGKGSSGEQRAWFQWSEKMYERGISINVEPSGAADIAKVEGLERTVQFIWKDVGKGATVSVEPYNKGDGAEDVYVDGDLLDKSVSVGIVADAAPVAKKRPKKTNKSAEQDAPQSKENGNDHSAGKAAGAAAAGAAGGGLLGSLATKGSNAPAPIAAVAPGKAERDDSGRPKYPDDAMLILGPDLYFTRSQVMAISALLGIVVVLARVL